MRDTQQASISTEPLPNPLLFTFIHPDTQELQLYKQHSVSRRFVEFYCEPFEITLDQVKSLLLLQN